MERASKNISKALYAAWLIAQSEALASVFRISVEGETEPYYFATGIQPEFIGHIDAMARLPRAKKIRHVDFVASVAGSAVEQRVMS